MCTRMSVGVLSRPDPTVAALPLRMVIEPWFDLRQKLELEDTDTGVRVLGSQPQGLVGGYRGPGIVYTKGCLFHYP
jgi:hypothetical protein